MSKDKKGMKEGSAAVSLTLEKLVIKDLSGQLDIQNCPQLTHVHLVSESHSKGMIVSIKTCPRLSDVILSAS